MLVHYGICNNIPRMEQSNGWRVNIINNINGVSEEMCKDKT
jgi:hypothetical protein